MEWCTKVVTRATVMTLVIHSEALEMQLQLNNPLAQLVLTVEWVWLAPPKKNPVM